MFKLGNIYFNISTRCRLQGRKLHNKNERKNVEKKKYFMQHGKAKIKQFSLLKMSKAHHETWLMSLKLGFHQIITRACRAELSQLT